MIQTAAWGPIINRNIKDGGIEYSTDDSSWTSAYEFTNLFGVGSTSNTSFALLTFTAQTARYWRIRIDANYTDSYVGTGEWILWDSTLIGARLDVGLSITSSPDAGTASATELSNRILAAYGLFYDTPYDAVRKLHVDFGSVNYFGGLDVVKCSLGLGQDYWPIKIDLWTSADGTTWAYRESTTLVAGGPSLISTIVFSRIYNSRYVRMIFHSQADPYRSVQFVEWFIYATLTPAAPPDPTSVTARASNTGTDIELTWGEIAGDDNLLADLVYKVERQKDGAGWSTLTSTHPVTHYVDTSLAAGAYDYRITAINSYHARESSAVQTGASTTSPAAAGGGAGRTGAVSSQLVGASRQP